MIRILKNFLGVYIKTNNQKILHSFKIVINYRMDTLINLKFIQLIVSTEGITVNLHYKIVIQWI